MALLYGTLNWGNIMENAALPNFVFYLTKSSTNYNMDCFLLPPSLHIYIDRIHQFSFSHTIALTRCQCIVLYLLLSISVKYLYPPPSCGDWKWINRHSMLWPFVHICQDDFSIITLTLVSKVLVPLLFCNYELKQFHASFPDIFLKWFYP